MATVSSKPQPKKKISFSWYTFLANSFIFADNFSVCSIFAGNSNISFLNDSITELSTFSNTSAKYSASIFNKITCEVYAFVDATAISGPACV